MEISYLGNFEYQLRHKGVKVIISPTETRIETESGPIKISGPGEYEVKGVLIAGFKGDKDKVIYTFDIDEIKVAYLGEVKQKLTDKQLDLLDGVDVLLVSAEGVDLVKQVKPSLVIPIDNQDKKKTDAFVKLMELEPKKEKKLVVSKLGLPEETELIIL